MRSKLCPVSFLIAPVEIYSPSDLVDSPMDQALQRREFQDLGGLRRLNSAASNRMGSSPASSASRWRSSGVYGLGLRLGAGWVMAAGGALWLGKGCAGLNVGR